MDHFDGGPSSATNVDGLGGSLEGVIFGSKKHKKREPSKVLTHFNKVVIKNEDGTNLKDDQRKVVMRAYCKVCNNKLKFGDTSGTIHLSHHMTSCLRRNASGGQL